MFPKTTYNHPPAAAPVTTKDKTPMNTITGICNHCEKHFPVGRYATLYCSNACRQAAYRARSKADNKAPLPSERSAAERLIAADVAAARRKKAKAVRPAALKKLKAPRPSRAKMHSLKPLRSR